MVSLFALTWSKANTDCDLPTADRRTRKPQPIRPVAPFTREPVEAAEMAFDRETGSAVAARRLKSYRQLLAQYHLHPEAKFLNADYTDTGVTERRHVFAAEIRHIGKEANKWEQQFFTGADDDAEVEYGAPAADIDALISAAKSAVQKAGGMRTLARTIGLSERHLRGVISGQRALSEETAQSLKMALPSRFEKVEVVAR